MHGSLRSQSIPRLLYKLWQSQETGTLHVQRRLVSKELVFRNGELCQANSNLLNETLGPFLHSKGTITAEQLETVQKEVEQSGKRLGEVIVAHGFVKAVDLFNELRALLLQKAVDCFRWDDGKFQFHVDELPEDDMLGLNVDPFHLLVQGIQTNMPFELMRQDTTLILNKPTRVAGATLPDWASGYLNAMSLKLLKAFHIPKKPRFIMQDLNIEEEVMLRIVYLFDVTGLLINTEKPLAAETGSKSGSEAGSQSSPPPEHGLVALSDKEQESLVNDIASLSLRLHDLTHFALLNVEEDATVTQIRIAFLEFLKRFNLALFQRGPLAEHRDQVENLILSAGEAFGDLKDLESKTAYVDRLKAKRKAANADKKKPGASFAIKTELLDAGPQFDKGVSFLEQRKYESAVKYFEYAVDIDGQEPLYVAYLAWAKFQLNPQAHGIEAMELFETALKKGKDRPKLNMLYGKFLIEQNDQKQGLFYLKKAASQSPRDQEIQRTLRVAQAQTKH